MNRTQRVRGFARGSDIDTHPVADVLVYDAIGPNLFTARCIGIAARTTTRTAILVARSVEDFCGSVEVAGPAASAGHDRCQAGADDLAGCGSAESSVLGIGEFG